MKTSRYIVYFGMLFLIFSCDDNDTVSSLNENLEEETIKQFSKLASKRSKKIFQTTKNTTISFTFGNWALPYLKLLKKIGIAK